MKHVTTWDAVIVGGGAAALSAAIVLARTGIDVVAIDSRTPRNAPAAHMHGFISRDGMNPGELLETGRRELVQYGGRILAATAARIDATDAGGMFAVHLEDGSVLRSPAVVVATGIRDELPAISGIEELWGDVVHHCPHCHGAEVRGQRLAVVGGAVAPMSLHQAALMRRYSNDVTFITNGIEIDEQHARRFEAIALPVQHTSVSAVERVEGGVALTTTSGERAVYDAVFIGPAMRPRDELLVQLGVTKSAQSGFVDVGPTGRTSVNGVWAIGNVANPRAQVITAAGEGSAAAIDVTAFLLERELDLAVAGESVGLGSRR